MKETKLIVTHRGALLAKYGRQGVAKVDAAVAKLVEADAKRGIVSRVVALDAAEDMAPFGTEPMGARDDRPGAKRAIDAIDIVLRPHYFMILGSWDVVPMQMLHNTMGAMYFWPGGDTDVQVPSDLPYACETAASEVPADFLGPTRVVGRLPDEPGASKPDFLVKVLGFAARAKPLPRRAYDAWMGLTAASWLKSSAQTAKAVFGDAKALKVCPPHPDDWSRAKLAPRVHFINCHGSPLRAWFDGEPAQEVKAAAEQLGIELESKGVALSAASLAGKIRPGTVVVAECCYGAEVYNRRSPEAKPRGQPSMALAYLGEGAAGFFGSTTTSYGMWNRNAWADILCKLFLKRLLSGASIGRAALMARHDFVGRKAVVDPFSLKALAQFCLLGDPSIHPVERSGAKAERRPRVDSHRLERARRQRARETLRREGRALAGLRRQLKAESGISDELMNDMLAEAEQYGLKQKAVRLFTLAQAGEAFAGGRRDDETTADAMQFLGLVGALDPADEANGGYIAIMAKVVLGRMGKPMIGFSK